MRRHYRARLVAVGLLFSTIVAGCNSQTTSRRASDAGPHSVCTSNSDCDAGTCREGRCVRANCSDGIANGSETDVDCGGPGCSGCEPGQSCRKASDCASGTCRKGVCRLVSCSDGATNGRETDRDCGGPDCKGCKPGGACSRDGDCRSEICSEGTCATPSCEDGIHNGAETGVDCGGPDCSPCPVGSGCVNGSDCEQRVCIEGNCVARSCTDGETNGDETDRDCGGPKCNGCEPGASCGKGRDCESRVCKDGTCKTPTCDDGAMNGEELGKDCGGPDCSPCPSELHCDYNGDCSSGVCSPDDVCRPPTCDDRVENGSETAIDCGGERCPGCDVGEACASASDCTSRVCKDGSCAAPTCEDGVQNGAETDVDCGGETCDSCPLGSDCEKGSDCEPHDVCSDGTCRNCKDGTTRTVDCGFKNRGTKTQTCKNRKWTGGNCKGVWREDCAKIAKANPSASTGTYEIDPDGNGGVSPFDVTCEMSDDGGGWITLHPYEKSPKVAKTPDAVATEFRDDNGIEDGDGDAGNVSSGMYQHLDVAGGDSTFQGTPTDADHDGGGDSDDITLAIGYESAGNKLSSKQLAAIRGHVSTLSKTTEQAITTTDNDDHGEGGGLDVWAIDAGGSRKVLTPADSEGDSDYRWSTKRLAVECNGRSCRNEYDKNDTLPTQLLLPAKIRQRVDTGGGMVWWYEKPYVLVK